MDGLGLTRGVALRLLSQACFTVAIAAMTMVSVIGPQQVPGVETPTGEVDAQMVSMLVWLAGCAAGVVFTVLARRAGAVPLRDTDLPPMARSIHRSSVIVVAWLTSAALFQLASPGGGWVVVAAILIVLAVGTLAVQIGWTWLTQRIELQLILGVSTAVVGSAVVLAGATVPTISDRSASIVSGAVVVAIGLWMVGRVRADRTARAA